MPDEPDKQDDQTPWRRTGIIVTEEATGARIADTNITGYEVGIEARAKDLRTKRVNIRSDDTEHPKNTESGSAQHWYQNPIWVHPITKTVLYVVGVVGAGALLYFLGWK